MLDEEKMELNFSLDKILDLPTKTFHKAIYKQVILLNEFAVDDFQKRVRKSE